jgi:hypothetical protein
MTRKPIRRSKAPQLAFYIVQITAWDWSYSFGVNSTPYRDTRYNEYRHLHVFGTLLIPRKIKVEKVELVFLPDLGPTEMEQHGEPPRCAGSLSIWQNALDGNLSMPKDALNPVMQMLLAGRLKYVVLHGKPTRYRKALIRNYRMVAEVDPDDYPDGD